MTRTAAVHEAVLDRHADLLEAVLACADWVADSWDSEGTTDRAAVVDPFEHALEHTGVHRRLPAVLVTAVDAIGGSLSAEPVAAPPYVTVTSRGPVLRATLETDRLVLTVRAFDVERDPTRYVRGATAVEDVLGVEFRSR
ncbi:hypothetical protein [Halococcus hamelinensis]|uniref:DUF7988 domain-containing protein n=1 Tax=Halococcus hamelinensis 100A6 TaxID=1132509 RepID=M0M285_9EURY|nr:hypothetical protein [Halococcus hamelinensis]EMA39942.1 hypothetical protein C447_05303 [Halococcus hamelinensis 100A6]